MFVHSKHNGEQQLQVRVEDLSTGSSAVWGPFPGRSGAISWAGDARVIAFFAACTSEREGVLILVLCVRTGVVRTIKPGGLAHDDTLSVQGSLTLLAQASHLVVRAMQSSWMQVWQLECQQLLFRLPNLLWASAQAWAPNSRVLAVSHLSPSGGCLKLSILDAYGTRLAHIPVKALVPGNRNAVIMDVSWDASGTRILFALRYDDRSDADPTWIHP